METDRHINKAVAIGEANKRVLGLLQNWCAHLAIEKDGHGGLIEQFTSLPIGPRSLTCPHATAPGFSGHDLKFLALDFHDRNCVGCVSRKPVGFPNLSTLVHERDTARAAARAETARGDAAAVAARVKRDATRQAIRAALTPLSANVIDQIEDNDHGRDGGNADRLVETARLAPHVFTAPVVEYAFELLEAGEFWFDDVGLRLLKALNVERTRLTQCALLCIPRRLAARIAAEILIENLGLADETLVEAAVPALISMAKPPRLPFGGRDRRPDPTPLLRVYEAFPKAVETAIATLLDGAESYNIGPAARGIAVLAQLDGSLPGRFARSLVAKFIRDRRLLQAGQHYDGDHETLNELRGALALAYEAAPVATEELLSAFLEGASDIGEARIFSIYRQVLRRPQFEKVDVTEASRLALNRVVWHSTETNS